MIDIQTRLAYQEDTIAQLNEVITKQDADIISLTLQLRLLAKRFDDLHFDQSEAGAEIANERPPHY
jgi:SlyX protein